MINRLLVTGCGGFVGGGIVHETPRGVELHAVARKEPPERGSAAAWHMLDLRDRDGVQELFETVSPDAVIHAAAIADIDFCEANRETAWVVNVSVTQQLADLCREHGTRLVYVSTDNVFDGKRGAYREEDAPTPINYYAETKAAGERVVAGMGRNYVVARTSVVIGFPMLGSGNSFLMRMVSLLREGKRVGVPENEIRSPIDVVTLARSLLELAGSRCEGYIHLAGNDWLNRYEMVRRIVRELGFSEDLIYPNNPETIPGRAPRPLDVSLCNQKARECLRTPMKNLQDGLRLVMETARPSYL
jgi:dTDP-4-dehydrorhamnose reductase